MYSIYTFLLVVTLSCFVDCQDVRNFGTRNLRKRLTSTDLDTAMSDSRLMKKYLDCLLGKGHCDQHGDIIKQALPDALASGCALCSPEQKQLIKQGIKKIKTDYPHEYNELVAIYDPHMKYEKFLNEIISS